MFYDRFIELCNQKGEKPTRAAVDAGISKSLVTKWKNNAAGTPSMDVIEKLARYFNVPVSDILSQGLSRCDECGFLYDSDDPEERRLHQEKHNRYKNALDKFGFIWGIEKREKMKSEARTIVENESKPIDARVDAQIIVFKALFSRSLMQNNFDLEHPDFEPYIAMILQQGKGKHSVPEELYDPLVAKFGVKEGIPVGTLYRKMTPPVGRNTDRGDTVLDLLNENELQLVYKYAEHLISLRPKQ